MNKLEDIDVNINPLFKGNINIDEDLYAFIDESGDEGFNFGRHGTSKWFNVSAIIISPTNTNAMVKYIRDYKDRKYPDKGMNKMSSKSLEHNQKKDIFTGLSKFDFKTTHSLFYKPDLSSTDPLVVYPSMYFVGVKNIIERISWYTRQSGKRRTHIIISNRNNISQKNMQEYLFRNSIIADKNLYYPDKIGIVKLSNSNKRDQLLLADYSAYTLRMCFEEQGDPPCSQPYYFDMFQKGKLYSSNHKTWGGIWQNGVKLTPPTKSLIEQSGILNEGSHKS